MWAYRERGDAAAVAAALRRARAFARVLDTAFRIPGTSIRFGLDSLIGLLPVVGDTATALVGLYPVAEGVRFGVRRRVLAKMLANLGIDWLIGLVPLLDIVLDVGFKANVRNVTLLQRELEMRAGVMMPDVRAAESTYSNVPRIRSARYSVGRAT